MNKKKSLRPTRFVGYIRVSTKEQEQTGISLTGQADLLRSYVEQNNGQLTSIYEDARSAHRSGAASRAGLMDAIKTCIDTGEHLLVPSIDRLTRSISTFEELDVPGLKIVSVREGRIGKKRLRSLIESAQQQSDEISRRSKEAAAAGKARGVLLGNRVNLGEAQRLGTLATKERASRKINALADFIDAHPETQKMTLRERVEMLNRQGHRNLVSERNGVSKIWTGGSLRKPWKGAVDLLEERYELEVDEVVSMTVEADVISLPTPARIDIPCAHSAPVGPVGEAQALSVVAPASFLSAEAGGAPQAMGGATFAAPAHGVGGPGKCFSVSVSAPVAPLSHVSYRPLTTDEIVRLRSIMSARRLKNVDVMDELGLVRLNPTLWMSLRNGTNVHGDVIERLGVWLTDNDCFIVNAA